MQTQLAASQKTLLSSDTLRFSPTQIFTAVEKVVKQIQTPPRKISTPDVEAPLLQLSIVLTGNRTSKIDHL